MSVAVFESFAALDLGFGHPETSELSGPQHCVGETATGVTGLEPRLELFAKSAEQDDLVDDGGEDGGRPECDDGELGPGAVDEAEQQNDDQNRQQELGHVETAVNVVAAKATNRSLLAQRQITVVTVAAHRVTSATTGGIARHFLLLGLLFA